MPPSAIFVISNEELSRVRGLYTVVNFVNFIFVLNEI